MGPGGRQGDVCCPLKGATILFCPFRKNDQSPPLFVRNQITFDFPSTAADLLRREKIRWRRRRLNSVPTVLSRHGWARERGALFNTSTQRLLFRVGGKVF